MGDVRERWGEMGREGEGWGDVREICLLGMGDVEHALHPVHVATPLLEQLRDPALQQSQVERALLHLRTRQSERSGQVLLHTHRVVGQGPGQQRLASPHPQIGGLVAPHSHAQRCAGEGRCGVGRCQQLVAGLSGRVCRRG